MLHSMYTSMVYIYLSHRYKERLYFISTFFISMTQAYTPHMRAHKLSICYVPQSYMYAYTCKCRWDMVLLYVGLY